MFGMILKALVIHIIFTKKYAYFGFCVTIMYKFTIWKSLCDVVQVWTLNYRYLWNTVFQWPHGKSGTSVWTETVDAIMIHIVKLA